MINMGAEPEMVRERQTGDDDDNIVNQLASLVMNLICVSPSIDGYKNTV